MHHASKHLKGKPEAVKEAQQGKVSESSKPKGKAAWTHQREEREAQQTQPITHSSTGILRKSDGDAKLGARDQAINALRRGPSRMSGDPTGLGGAPGLSTPSSTRRSSLELGTNAIKPAALPKPVASRDCHAHQACCGGWAC